MRKINVVESIEKDVINYSVNVNAFGVPNTVKEAMNSEINELCRFYPDNECNDLRRELSNVYGIDCEYFYCANGADDIIFRIPIAFKPKKAIIVAPTYEEYSCSLEMIDCKVEYYILNEKNEFRLTDDILGIINDDIDIVYICNPNNPTGVPVDISLMKKIADTCRNNYALLVIDESFIGFMVDDTYSMKRYIQLYDNVIIIDAFTKLYGIPGYRLGYCISSNREFLNKIKKSGQEYNVSVPAQVAGIAALQDKKYIEDTRIIFSKERIWLTKELINLGFEVCNSETNFILVKSLFSGYRDKLLENGIKVRYCGDFVGLEGEYIRIAVLTREYNKKLIDRIKETLK